MSLPRFEIVIPELEKSEPVVALLVYLLYILVGYLRARSLRELPDGFDDLIFGFFECEVVGDYFMAELQVLHFGFLYGIAVIKLYQRKRYEENERHAEQAELILYASEEKHIRASPV
ncbi:hypothetical protein SDC9_207405 [bioreactor metagenome]|uniref:Uncharacterized protein n=1 Tax=bioreactor metagenome TaxID=1076179 RepID=A0A645JJ80_9ZZZZ